ncbi:hypothetical protein GWI33_006904 [Rhynchophorus ferrugineus]|uniref:GOLD domain-containing protein n=1 Tax=Rhynchophorus ferrugineus TaxID=354439 RepID=A0A834MKW2_RHYFE|nr:hypothetical protein GWI33_006904 [Rhynchophorus ferrugineus]
MIKPFFCFEKEFTVNVDASKEDCFYQPMKIGDTTDIEYQVISGGELDISLNIFDPTGRVLVADFKKSENSHTIVVQMNGDYKFCFDNKFSSFSAKTIFFELIVDNSEEDKWDSDENYNFDDVDPSVIYNLKLTEVQEIVNNVRDNLNKAKHLQDMIKSTEARDRNVAEEAFFRVNVYSILILVVMILVSFVQLFMVKSLFEEKSKVHSFWSYLERIFH